MMPNLATLDYYRKQIELLLEWARALTFGARKLHRWSLQSIAMCSNTRKP
jgi:hypothetical protein